MAKGVRKVNRTQSREPSPGGSGKAKKRLNKAPIVKPVEAPDPLKALNLKSLGLRLGLPVLALWLIGGFVASISVSQTIQGFAVAIPTLLTIAVVILLLWALKQARKAKGMAGILSGATNAEDRAAALEQLETGYKKKDPSAIFAKAQLLMHEDADKALETLEQIDLNKVMAPVADEARAQRAMLHLMKGQVTHARDLVDAIELSRHQDAKSRAMMAAVIAEAWARSGQAKKGVDTLELFNADDPEFEQVRPQLYRAQAFAYAYTSDVKGMRRALRRLVDQDARLLGSFLGKKTHPLLQKEAKKMLEQSGQVPRKMVVQRRV